MLENHWKEICENAKLLPLDGGMIVFFSQTFSYLSISPLTSMGYFDLHENKSFIENFRGRTKF